MTNKRVKLEKEFNYFLNNLDELVEKYKGKYIAIKDENVLGAYDTMEQAISETNKMYELGTFLIQKCESGEEAYTQTYHSRVSFA
jgi:hypothetical protein